MMVIYKMWRAVAFQFLFGVPSATPMCRGSFLKVLSGFPGTRGFQPFSSRSLLLDGWKPPQKKIIIEGR